MKKIILIATCVAAFSAFTVLGASAQTSHRHAALGGPAAPQTMKTTDPMNANARMHHRKHKAMKKDDMSKDDTSKGDMSKDGMKKDGMSK